MRTIVWDEGVVKLIDQRRLPSEYVVVELSDYREVCRAIKEMWVRGAPAIGVAAACGMALGALGSEALTQGGLLEELEKVSQALRETRPTASNLFWAVERMMGRAQDEGLTDAASIREALVAEARQIADEDVQANLAMGEHGAQLINDGDGILTHCNAGALATVEYGTALACVRVAHQQGKRIHVFADETRPRLQGARLTAWELMREGIPMTLIVDSAAGFFMQSGQVDMVLVGADRVAANGDVANKIGTYNLAVVARENGIPFYVVAPTSTIDLSVERGADIPIEERDWSEVTHIGGVAIAPEGVRVANLAFDITPHRYISAIITERGIARPPFTETLKAVLRGEEGERI